MPTMGAWSKLRMKMAILNKHFSYSVPPNMALGGVVGLLLFMNGVR